MQELDPSRPPMWSFGHTNLVAVGTAIARRPPHRSQRAALPHWAPTLGHDAEAHVGEWMSQARGWQRVIDQAFHSLPCQSAGLAPPPQRTAPVPGDMVVERIDRPTVGWNGEVVEVAVHHSFQVKCLLRDRPVHYPPYRLFDLPDLLPQPLPNGVPQDEIAPAFARSADMCEAKEGEGLRLAKPLCLAVAFPRSARTR